MEEMIISSMDDAALTPSDFITLMFERTDEDGLLFIPSFSVDDRDYRCRVDWNLEKYETLLQKFEKHHNAIKSIAKVYDEIDNDSIKAKELLKNGVWIEA